MGRLGVGGCWLHSSWGGRSGEVLIRSAESALETARGLRCGQWRRRPPSSGRSEGDRRPWAPPGPGEVRTLHPQPVGPVAGILPLGALSRAGSGLCCVLGRGDTH